MISPNTLKISMAILISLYCCTVLIKVPEDHGRISTSTTYYNQQSCKTQIILNSNPVLHQPLLHAQNIFKYIYREHFQLFR